MMVKDSDGIMAEAIRLVQGLYQEGTLKTPADWKFAPDLLQFYETKSTVEQDLYVVPRIQDESIRGAFHMNPDYTHCTDGPQ